MARGGIRGAGADAQIEFLAPDSHAFATSSADGFVDVGGDRPGEFDDDEQPRSPRVTVATGGGVLALFAVAVIAAQPWRTDEAAPATAPAVTATTTAAPPATPATVAATTTTARAAPAAILTPTLTLAQVLAMEERSSAAVLDRGYVARLLPPGFELRDLDTAPRGHEPGWLEVWATPGAHRSKGSWFAIQINDDGKVEARSTADRVDVGRNRFGLLSHTSDGVALLRFITPGGTGVAITAGGWTDADLIALASGMGHVGLRPVFGTSPMMDQHEMLWSGPAVGVSVDEAYAFGDARAGSTYEREDDGATIAISVAPAHPAEAILPRFVLAEDPDVPFSGHFVRRSLDGRALTVGLLPGLDDQRIVTWWEDDGTRVSVVGDLPLGELIDVVGSVHGASAEDWSEAMMEARGFEADGRPPGAAADDVGRVIGLFGEILD